MKKQSKSVEPAPIEPVAVAVEEPTPNGTAAVAEVVATDEWDAVVNNSRPALPPLTIERHEGTFNPAQAKILIYGESGVGKSRFASTFPNVLFIDMDLGMSSITEQVDKLTIEDFRQLSGIHEYLAGGDHPYTAVVLDTLNEMQRLAMGSTIDEFPKIKGRAYGNLPNMADYGKMLHDMVEMTRKFISLPMQVILISQVNSRQFDTDVLQPQLIGKNTARELARKMDVIGYIYKVTEQEQEVPHITFSATNYVTKDRSFKLPAVLPGASYDSLMEYWS